MCTKVNEHFVKYAVGKCQHVCHLPWIMLNYCFAFCESVPWTEMGAVIYTEGSGGFLKFEALIKNGSGNVGRYTAG